MKTEYISNKLFCHLSPKDREYLKADYHNYIPNGKAHIHYIQDPNPYWAMRHVYELETAALDHDLIIYIKDEVIEHYHLTEDPSVFKLF